MSPADGFLHFPDIGPGRPALFTPRQKRYHASLWPLKEKNRMELLALLDKGYTVEDLRRELTRTETASRTD